MKLILFDLDGTLVESTKCISDIMLSALKYLKSNNYKLAIVSGATIEKIKLQLKNNFNLFDYIFSENGLVSFEIKDNNLELISNNDIKDILLEKDIQRIINQVLYFVINTELPYKRGNFISFRKGMMYCTPIGGDCSFEERKFFITYDKQFNIRKKLIKYLIDNLSDLNLEFSLGGNIGVCVHPKGWNKSYCLKFIPNKYESIYFFGDRCSPDGNDYPLYSNNMIKSFSVINYQDTIKKIYLNF